MSDLVIAVSIAIFVVIGTITIFGYASDWNDRAEVTKLLPSLVCQCGKTPLSWNRGSWTIAGDSTKLADSTEDGHPSPCPSSFILTGFVFVCPCYKRELYFTRDGRVHNFEDF